MFGKKTSLAVVLILGIAAIAAILHLQAGATQSTKAQLLLSEVKVKLNALQSTPFRANPKTGGSPVVARREMDAQMSAITRELAALQADSPPEALEGILTPLNSDYTALEQIYRMAECWEAGRVVERGADPTIADGLAVRVAIPYAVDVLARAAQRMLRVDERELATAIGALASAGIRVEASGAAALAALAQVEDVAGPVVLIVTGRNIDDALYRRAVEDPGSFPTRNATA